MDNCEQMPDSAHDAASFHSTYAQAFRAVSLSWYFLDNAMQIILRLEQILDNGNADIVSPDVHLDA